jgi:hypothetical protein
MKRPMWFWRDGTPAVDPDLDSRSEEFSEQMGLVEKRLCDNSYKVVARTTLPDGKVVSTVWLGLNHDMGGPRPLIFESMVFPSLEDLRAVDFRRYATEEEAKAGHAGLVADWNPARA